MESSFVRRVVLLGLAALPSGALLAAPKTAVTTTIATAPRMLFANSVRELPAAQKVTLHAMTAAHQTDSVGFNIPLALRNQAELEARVNAGEVLSGEELKAKYFPLQSDYDAVAAWLKGEGFTVDAIADTNLAVFAHGTVAQVQASFQTEMGLVTAKGADHAVALSAPSLPAAIAGPALGVSGLSYRRPQSRLVHPDPSSTGQTNAVPSGGYHTSQLVTAYSGTGLAVNGTKLTGTGQTIAIEAYVQVNSNDLSTFWTANSVTRTGTVTTINVSTTALETDSGDIEENALDVEWASGIAPGANIVDYATSYDDNDSPERIYNRVITDASKAGSTIHELSSSYGPTEAELTSTELAAYNQIFISLTAAGCTYINATGDVGSSPVEAYGVFPYTFGVGGTSLNVNTSTYVRTTETGWSGSSGGVSANYAHPIWQTGNGTNSALKRQFPDVSLAADPSTGAYFDYTYKNKQTVGVIGGTSWSAPTFAGFMALIHQGRALNTPARGAVGFLNPRIYPLIGTTNFFDVTSGSNTGYSATAGYDMVTGVGVPNISTFLATLLGPTITGFTPTSGAAGTSVVITGTNFYSNTGYVPTVTFNGLAAASVMVNSATQITAVVPAHATTGPIVVTTFGDAATSAANFSVGTPDLSAASAHTGSFTQGDPADTYTLTVTNNGTGASTGTVTVTDTLPNKLTATALSGSGWTTSADHLSATRTDALPAGASYPPLTLTVSVGINTDASVTNTVAVSVGGEDSNSANNSGNDATTVTAATNSQRWRYQYFGTTANTGNAADGANPAGDGLPNLLKYALGLDPTVAEVSPVTVDTTSGVLRLTVNRNTNATDVTYSVQVTSNLSDPASWTTNGTTVDSNPGDSQLRVRDNTMIGTVPQRFIRLQVSR